MKPLHIHCLSAEPMRRLAQIERSRWGDFVATIVFTGSVTFFVAWVAGVIE